MADHQPLVCGFDRRFLPIINAIFMYQEEVLTCQNKVGFVDSLSVPLAAHHADSDVEDSDKENTYSK
jgi:hypothetical protein